MVAVRATGLTFFTYCGTQPGRLIGTVQSGETNLTATFTTANTRQIFATTGTGATQAFVPGNTFSPLKVLVPGQGYAIVGKSSFEFAAGFPSSSSEVRSNVLAAIQSAIGSSPGPSPNPPNPPSGTYLLGMNLTGYIDWDAGISNDRFHSARSPISITNGSFGQGTLDLDSQGFVRSLATGQTWTSPIAIEDARLNMPAGTYVFKWEGDRQKSTIGLRGGTLTYTTPITATEHRATFAWGGTQDIWIDGSNYATDIGSAYPKNFKLLLPGTENSTEVFNAPFMARSQWPAGYRFMDWVRSNWTSATSGNRSTTWEERPTLNSFSQATKNGGSIELAVALCNRTGKTGWFNIPVAYTNDAITKYLTYLRDNMNPQLKIIVEYTNENWQTAGNFLQGQYLAQTAKALGVVPASMPDYEAQWKYAAYQSANISKMADTIFAGQRDRINVTHNCQVGWGGAGQARLALNFIHPTYGVRCGEIVDSLAVAPYFGWELSYTETLPMTNTEMFDYLRSYIETTIVGWINNHITYATELGNYCISYENGQHFDLTGAQNDTERAFFASKFLELNLDPGMFDLYVFYYGKLRDRLGADKGLYAFSDTQRWGRGLAAPTETPSAYWGVSRTLTESLNVAVKRKALHFLAGHDLSQITEVSF